MRILKLITAFGYGGAERLVANTANHLTDKGYKVVIGYFKDEPKLASSLKPNIELIAFGLNRAGIKKLQAFITDFKPDVIHSHLGHSDLITLWVTKNLKARVFITLHNVYFKYNALDYFYYSAYFILLNLWNKKSKVLGISNATLKLAQKLTNKNRTFLTYNSIPDLVNFPTKKHFDNNHIALTYIGRLTKQKAVHNLIEGFAMLNDDLKQKFTVRIYGEGIFNKQLNELIESKGLNTRISLMGTSNQISEVIAQSDFLILTSIFEGLPTVFLEGFRSGVPAIGSYIDGNTDLINQGINGFIYGCPNCHAKLAETLTDITKLNTEQYAQLSENARKSFTQNYSIEQYCKNLLNLYQN